MPELYNELSFVVDLDKPIITTKMYNLFVTTSKKAHKVILTLRRGGQAVNFTGAVTATLITRADMVTQDANGKAEDGKVTFTFPPSFYGQSGIFDLIIFVDDQDSHVPVFCGEGNMIVGQTDSLYDPNKVVPSLAELLAQIENVRNAASSANSAASSANNAAASANSAATKANTAAGNANAATTAANNATDTANTAASNANAATTNANNAAGAANQAAGRAENVASKSPYIGDNGNWYVYDVTAGAFVDSGLPSRGIPGEGAVSTVNGKQPDAEGDVSIDAADVGAFVVEDGAGAHNAVYRGKNLGTAVTAEQYAAIADGTFRDLFVGDYWIINNVTYRIAAFDYYFNTGDTACTSHHVTLIPDANMYTHAMNDTNITTGAYVGSKMYTEGLNRAKETINTAFGAAHVLNHRKYLQNAVTDGYASGGSWYDSTVELMTEQNVYGCKIFGNVSNGTALPSNYTGDKSQYPLFTFRPDVISNRKTFWLRDVASLTQFARVTSDGNAGYNFASNAFGVCPAFSIIR